MLALTAIAPAIPVGADTLSKPWLITDNLSTVVAGTTNSFTFTITNKDVTSAQVMGSAEIAAPPGFTLMGAPSLSGTGTATPVGNAVELRGLALQPGSSDTVTFSLATSCAAGSGNFTARAKQSNNFSSQPGNAFTPDPTLVGVTITGSCSLVFTTQPADAQVSTVITTAPFGSIQNPPTGGPIEVDVHDGNNALASSSTDTVAVCATAPPTQQQPLPPCISPSPLGGTTTRNAKGGVVLFNDLTIGAQGSYGLQATISGTAVVAESSSFTIWLSASDCSAAGCKVSTPPSHIQTSSLSAPATSGTLELQLGVAPEPAQCTVDGFFHAPEGTITSSTGIQASVTQTLVVTIDKSQVLGNVNKYAICLQESNGTIVDPVPSCTSHGDLPPCVSSIKSDRTTGAINETILLNSDDPPGWW
jgi:hypothetical protein